MYGIAGSHRMATIDDLNISITQMNSPDLLALIHKLRFSRRTKKKITSTKSVQKKKPKAPNLSLLTNEQRLEILKDLEGIK